MDEVLRPVVLHFLCQNNARTHPARISKNSFHQNNVVRNDWPVPSSDMSTIEHVKESFGQRARLIILALPNLQSSMRRYRGILAEP